MTHVRFFCFPFRWKSLGLAALLLCALAGFGPQTAQAASQHHGGSSGSFPRGLVASPSTLLQTGNASFWAAARCSPRLAATVPVRGCAGPAVYRHGSGQWARLRSHVVKRTRRAVTLDVCLFDALPGARHVVLAHRKRLRRVHAFAYPGRHHHKQRPFHRKPTHAKVLTGPIVGSPPVHIGP